MTLSGSLPLIRLTGGSNEQGQQHGRMAKERIARNVDIYRRKIRDWSGVTEDELRRRSEAYHRVIERASPQYTAAMEGIAAGSGEDLLDIVAINVRYELLYSEFARVGMETPAARSTPGGCTSFAIRPERSANRHMLLGQNWDWIPEIQGILVRAETSQMPYLAFTEAGIAGAKIGLNAAKLGLAVNGLVSNRDLWSHLRTPFHVRCWEILASRTLEDAKASVVESERSCSANFLIAQAGNQGGVVDIEAAPERSCQLTPQDGRLVHTNHFLDPEALGISQPLAGDRPSTYRRRERATSMLGTSGKDGRTSIDDLMELLRDHDGGQLSICRHQDPDRPAHDRYETVVSVVMDLDDRVMFVASGPPCTSEYERFELTA
jgi:isopenicillin-N N-acyltransferase like protein